VLGHLRRCDTTRVIAVVGGIAPGLQEVVGDELADGAARPESGLASGHAASSIGIDSTFVADGGPSVWFQPF